MKRFWDKAEAVVSGTGFGVSLDGKPVRLPGGAVLAVGTRALAEAIAAEWQAAGGARDGEFGMEDVPLTRIAATAQEKIAPDPHATVAALAKFGETDLLCYRAADPPALVARQHAAWQPWLDWARDRLNADLAVTQGVIHVPQEPDALAALVAILSAEKPMVLAGLGVMVPALGSLVLGLAVAHGALDVDAAHEAAIVDDLFQEALWGADDEAVERRARIRAELRLAARVIALA